MMINPPFYYDTTLPPTPDQILFPPALPNNKIHKHPNQKKQRLYGLVKHLIGIDAFNHLAIMNDKRTLEGIGPSAICSMKDFEKYEGMVRGSYYYRYSFIALKCLVDGEPGSIFILDTGRRGTPWWCILLQKRSVNIMDQGAIQALLKDLFENYESEVTAGPFKYAITYKPREKL